MINEIPFVHIKCYFVSASAEYCSYTMCGYWRNERFSVPCCWLPGYVLFRLSYTCVSLPFAVFYSTSWKFLHLDRCTYCSLFSILKSQILHLYISYIIIIKFSYLTISFVCILLTNWVLFILPFVPALIIYSKITPDW